ncbi:hypothetical protein BEL01nite_86330 [Bradyrhizobium elkanii]|nr:hypothetical protein BEL01nite_86330 [Bradyrhizobium elkanii]
MDGGGPELRSPPEMIRQTHYWGHSSIPSVDGMDWKRVRTAAVKPPEIVG